MLPADSTLTRVILAVVLLALLGLLVWRAIRKGRRDYRNFKRLETTAARQKVFRKWVLDSLAFFGGSAVVLIVLTWQFIPRMLTDVDHFAPMAQFHSFLGDHGGLWGWIILAVILALVVGMFAIIVVLRNSKDVPTVGDIGAILPRNREEIPYGIALSVNAGVVEELLFRLALPALIYGISGNAVVAIVSSLVLFALLHLYQGLPGILGALGIGAVLMLVYLVTGSILWPILAHAIFDLRSLVFIPVVMFRVHKLSGDPEPEPESEPEDEPLDEADDTLVETTEHEA